MAFDAANCITDVWFRLGFASAADMAASTWLAQSELYQWADDAVKALARSSALFLDVATNPVTAGNAAYAMPARHIFTESAWLGYAVPPSVQLLRITTAAELAALDATWPLRTGPPKRLSLDAGDVHTATLYPSPVANATLAQIVEVYPPDIVLGASVVPCSAILQDAVSFAMIAGALSRESDHAKPEVAAHAMDRMSMYAEIVQKLWGAA